MSYGRNGPYGFMPELHNPPRLRDGVFVVPASKLPTVFDAVFAPETKSPVDIEQDANFISDPRNRSIVPSNDSSATPENVFKYDAKTSKELDSRVDHFKSIFNQTLLHFGAPASLAYEQASAEVEAILYSKFGVELKIDSEILDYANAIIDADLLTKLFKSTEIDPEIAKASLSDYIIKSFDSVRTAIKNRNKSDMIARYRSKLENLVAEEAKPHAVVRGRR